MKPFRHAFFIWGWPLLAQDNPLVLLDEPTTWLDINYQVELMRELQTMGKTVFTVLHDLNQASRYCDHLVVLEGGQVQAQGLAETVLTPEMLREIFHLEAEIYPEPVVPAPDVRGEITRVRRTAPYPTLISKCGNIAESPADFSFASARSSAKCALLPD